MGRFILILVLLGILIALNIFLAPPEKPASIVVFVVVALISAAIVSLFLRRPR
ncbi:MAG: hypothetical protein JO151_11690 [Verrucomicrobia bacterium]|jgi:membrane protein implicated in regulation of membrane protease activity|nr:hypothetical protein [Verrucomicrobiota bacterium]